MLLTDICEMKELHVGTYRVQEHLEEHHVMEPLSFFYFLYLNDFQLCRVVGLFGFSAINCLGSIPQGEMPF